LEILDNYFEGVIGLATGRFVMGFGCLTQLSSGSIVLSLRGICVRL